MGKQFVDNNRGRGGGRGGNRGGNRGGSRGGRGGRPGGFDQGPPAFVIPYATFLHKSQNSFVVKCVDSTRFPKFNRGVYLQSKAKVGSVDEILGPVTNFYFSIKPQQGVKAQSFKPGQVFFMNPEDLLPMDRFSNKSRPQAGRGDRGANRGQPTQRGRPQGNFQRGKPFQKNFKR